MTSGPATPSRPDFLILGTGFPTDPRPAGSSAPPPRQSGSGATSTRRRPARKTASSRSFPTSTTISLSAARAEGAFPWLANVYCFNYGATASLGKVSGDIPGVSEGAQVLARSIAARLYVEDI